MTASNPPTAVEALTKCAEQFTFYAEQHHAKGTTDGDLKAKVNLDMAEMCILALLNPTSPWRPIEDAPRDGTTILVAFKSVGVQAVAWTEPEWADYKLWCVDDRKHGPYPLRGYSEGDELGWMPLPALPGGENP